MPIYEYICLKCEHELEIVQKITAGALRKCPSCNSLKLRRKISRSAFHLKGDGWYVTDYANTGKENESKESDKTASDSKAKDTTSTKESKNSSKEKTKSTKVDKVKSST
ncbi:MAG: zinc ribbon domain-containing protein [Nitrospinota bacterium]|nr:zinc ribbon domain-containing protein [Nitrospinota bacterium]